MKQQTTKTRNRDRSLWWEQDELKRFSNPLCLMVAQYCFQGPQTTGPGLFRFNLSLAQQHLRLDEDTFSLCFWEVLDTLGWRWDAEQQVLWITDWFDWHEVRTARELRQLLEPLRKLPETPWYFEFEQTLPAQLPAKLHLAWQAWFHPEQASLPSKSPRKFRPLRLETLCDLQVEDIPRVVEESLHPRTHYLVKQWFDRVLREWIRLDSPPATQHKSHGSQPSPAKAVSVPPAPGGQVQQSKV